MNCVRHAVTARDARLILGIAAALIGGAVMVVDTWSRLRMPPPAPRF